MTKRSKDFKEFSPSFKAMVIADENFKEIVEGISMFEKDKALILEAYKEAISTATFNVTSSYGRS